MLELPDNTEYIDVTDLTSQPDDKYFRKVSLGFNSKHPISLLLLGNLAHNTEITFDKRAAKKLISWLEFLIATMD